VSALDGHLERLREMIAGLPAGAYAASPSRVSGPVGAHVRHCLDHVRALVSVIDSNQLCYDSRLRGTRIETDPLAALEELDRLRADIEELANVPLDRPVQLSSLTDRDGSTLRVTSTFGREIAFVIQHTIHHAAIISILLDQLGVQVPKGFGYAPSTPVPALVCAR
jgi:uncharacterized damage-inducible protein DinB